jgi:hypothetical protein
MPHDHGIIQTQTAQIQTAVASIFFFIVFHFLEANIWAFYSIILGHLSRRETFIVPNHRSVVEQFIETVGLLHVHGPKKQHQSGR